MSLVPIFVALVALSTYFSRPPQHVRGIIVYYGPQYLVQANADYRNYDLAPYQNCGVSAISPMALGRIHWIKLPNGKWFGPCLGIDAVSRRDYYRAVYKHKEIAEVSDNIRDLFAYYGRPFYGATQTEIWLGECPPYEFEHSALWWTPQLEWETDVTRPTPPLWPIPEQELPQSC